MTFGASSLSVSSSPRVIRFPSTPTVLTAGLGQHLRRGLQGRLGVRADHRFQVRALLLDLPLEPRVADDDLVLGTEA